MTTENEVENKSNEAETSIKKESQRHPIALGILAVSLLLGIVADILLRTTFWGLNFSIIVFCLAIGLYLLTVYQKSRPLPRVTNTHTTIWYTFLCTGFTFYAKA